MPLHADMMHHHGIFSLSLIAPLTFPAALVVAIIFLLLVLPSSRDLQQAPPGSHDASSGDSNTGRRDAIKSAFRFAWNGYYTLAFPHDELKPLSNTPGSSRNDWGATAVDALGTAILMEMPETVWQILAHVKSIDFNSTSAPISVFESTIRYMGGLLSAYELLAGPFASLNPHSENILFLVHQAEILGRVLSSAFAQGNALPSGELEPYTFKGNGKNSLAGAGTLILEWMKLAELTKTSEFGQLAQKAEEYLLNPRPPAAEAFPGIVVSDVDIVTGQFQPLASSASWGGSSDSFYEYLLKTYLYDAEAFVRYKDRWVAAANSTITHLASNPKGYPDITFLGRYDGASAMLVPESGHMECFAGGNFMLGGLALSEPRYTEFGLKLTQGCRHAYISTATRIGPEKLMWVPSECGKTKPRWRCDDKPPSKKAQDLNNKSGFWITESSYNLRPEVIESYYYAYRITRDQKYRDWAWDAWQAIDNMTRLEHGFSYLADVDSTESGVGDNQESFLFSETLKYLFLIFSDDDGEWHVNGKGGNAWVYSTEGHPFRVRQKY